MKNFHLFLNKEKAFIGNPVNQNFKFKKLSERERDGKNVREARHGRGDELKQYSFNGSHYNGLWADLKQRQIEHAKIVCNKVIDEPIILSPDWRLVVGLGNPSVYETSITLHHVYGFPYIPSSAVKGILRNYIINEYFDLSNVDRQRFSKEEWGKEKEKKALQNLGFCRIFGCPEGSARVNKNLEHVAFKGDVIFFDALPVTEPNIEMDIMTVHYPKYYGEGTLPPADWQNPTPIPFLTVKDKDISQKSAFQFIIGTRKGVENQEVTINDNLIGNLLDLTDKLLSKALKDNGIGAKTAVGYGYMK
jgi:CRISPR-associated protein Cmr6